MSSTRYSYLAKAYPGYAGKFGSAHGSEDRYRSEENAFPVHDDSFTCTIPRLVDHMKQNPGRIEVRNLGYLVGLVHSRGLPLHSTALHFDRSNMHRDGHVYIDGRGYAPRSTHNENFHKNGSLWLTPQDYCRGGEMIRIDGREFSPDEGIELTAGMKFSLIDRHDTDPSHHERPVPNNTVVKTDLYGRFVVLFNVPSLPRGNIGYLTISVSGKRSAKYATKSIRVG